MDRLFGAERPERLGIAVSGGGDSMALMHLMADWAKGQGVSLFAATVDHGLRPEAAGEADLAAKAAAQLGIPHTVLTWQGWDGQGNLPDVARTARYGLLRDWAHENRLDAVALGHTADDQAETVLMNLARGSGVEGLSGIAPRHAKHGVPVIRPLLGLEREALRGWLREKGIEWADDPTNDDPGFDRPKIRQAMALLGDLGLDVGALGDTAARMATAREALAHRASAVAAGLAAEDQGDLLIDLGALTAVEADTKYRIVAQALIWVASAPYRPRLAALTDLLARLEAGETAGTLHGCLIRTANRELRISREFKAVEALWAPAANGAVWDNRWRFTGTAPDGAVLKPLGPDGLKHLKDTGHERPPGAPPRDSLLAAPSLWHEDQPILAPLAGLGDLQKLALAPPLGPFTTSFLSH